MNQDNKTLLLVKTALFMALITAATMVVQIPSPTQGYVNLGDCFVILSGWVLGPLYGFIAGGVGSALTDFIMGYSYYAPATFLFKGLSAYTAAFILSKTSEKTSSLVVSGICGELFVVLGYFGFSSLILGKGLAAALSIPGNIFQAAVGITLSTIIYHFLRKAKVVKK